MGLRTLKLRRLLLEEAARREAHADELAELAARATTAFHAPTLRNLVHSQRVRAMELRGQAAVLDMGLHQTRQML